MKILAAKVLKFSNGNLEIVVKCDEPYGGRIDGFVYEEREGLYRAENENGKVSFYYWKGPENSGGFSGAEWEITMNDGSTRVLKGPWSSRSGVVNIIYPDREPVVECVTTDSSIISVTKKRLEELGLRFKEDRKWGELYFVPTNLPIPWQRRDSIKWEK